MSGVSSFDLWWRAAQDFEKAGQLRDREMELKAQISAITGAAKETTDAEAETTAEGGGPLVTEADIAHIVAQWTGIPVEKVRWATALHVLLLRAAPLTGVVGQPEQRARVLAACSAASFVLSPVTPALTWSLRRSASPQGISCWLCRVGSHVQMDRTLCAGSKALTCEEEILTCRCALLRCPATRASG